MRHQWQQAETNYRKLPVVQQRTAVWDESIKAYRVEEGNRVIDHIGDPNLVMNPIPDDLKPTKPPEAPIYQSGAGSPLRRATADIPVDMEWVNEYMPKKMAWDITMATRGATDRARFQKNYARIRQRQTSQRNREYHLRNERKIVAKRILRRIALRGGTTSLTQASRDNTPKKRMICRQRSLVSFPKMNGCQRQLLRNLKKKYGITSMRRTLNPDRRMNGRGSPRRNGPITLLSEPRIR